ncbi:MAG: hypothetical protein O3A00_26985 [Planctomycetota bacterium]|nr:hypothetical protein [Planctomycetota bacterium]
MLRINTDILPQTCLTYLAFRVSFRETYERILLARQVNEEAEGFGFLTEVPFLKAVPPHVQLDLLAETWKKHSGRRRSNASLVDESVVYAACETAARIVDDEPQMISHFLDSGPTEFTLAVDRSLSAQLRSLHLNLSNEGDFLLISQFEDTHPDEARWLKDEFELDNARFESMFEVLGRWHFSPDFDANLKLLLTDREIARIASVFPRREARDGSHSEA